MLALGCSGCPIAWQLCVSALSIQRLTWNLTHTDIKTQVPDPRWRMKTPHIPAFRITVKKYECKDMSWAPLETPKEGKEQ